MDGISYAAYGGQRLLLDLYGTMRNRPRRDYKSYRNAVTASEFDQSQATHWCIVMSGLLLNTHAVAIVQSVKPLSDTLESQTTMPSTMDATMTLDNVSQAAISAKTDRLEPRCTCGRKQEFFRLMVYGHHSLLGARGPRSGRAHSLHDDDLVAAACALWANDFENHPCTAGRTIPQPPSSGSEFEAITMLATYGPAMWFGPVILADINLFGGVPRRHSLQVRDNGVAGHIIDQVDHDRSCIPKGHTPCMVVHGSHRIPWFDELTVHQFFFLQILEDHIEQDMDFDDLTSLQQTSFTISRGFTPHLKEVRFDPSDLDETCLLDEEIYPYPYPRDENEILDLPPRHLWLNQFEASVTLQSMLAQFPDRTQLDTYGLHGEYIGDRVTRITSADVTSIVRAVASLWAEYAIGSHMQIFHANPQPDGAGPNTLVVIVTFPERYVDHTTYRAVLIDSKENGHFTDRVAAYIPRDGAISDVAQALSREGICWPQGLDECHLQSKGRQYSHQDRIPAEHGDYVIFAVYAFMARFGLLRNAFPEAHQFGRDFLWRSRHYGLQEFTVVIYAITNHYERVPPRQLQRTVADIWYAEELWQDATQLWSSHGAGDQSQLHTVWPQGIPQTGPGMIHLILSIHPVFPWTPILMSVIIHFGNDFPRRIETQAWQVPRRLSVQHLITLAGLGRFARDHASEVRVDYARNSYVGDETMIDIERGGNYELHLTMPGLNDFILSIAQHLHEQDIESAEDSPSDSAMEPVAEGTGDGMQGSQEPSDDDSLLQIGLFPLSWQLTQASFTDFFIDRTWALTARKVCSWEVVVCSWVSGCLYFSLCFLHFVSFVFINSCCKTSLSQKNCKRNDCNDFSTYPFKPIFE